MEHNFGIEPELNTTETAEEMILMFHRTYRESVISFIDSCKDPLTKKKLTDALNKIWREK